MTPKHKIQQLILIQNGYIQPDTLLTGEAVDDLYCEIPDTGDRQDCESEMRHGQVATNLPCPHSRYYEAKSVAAKMADGSWVGWTYWYGGGKHAEPDAIPWMEDAYDINCVEEEKLMIVRTFSLKTETAQAS